MTCALRQEFRKGGSCCMELGFQVSPSGEGLPGTLATCVVTVSLQDNRDPSAQDIKCEDT